MLPGFLYTFDFNIFAQCSVSTLKDLLMHSFADDLRALSDTKGKKISMSSVFTAATNVGANDGLYHPMILTRLLNDSNEAG